MELPAMKHAVTNLGKDCKEMEAHVMQTLKVQYHATIANTERINAEKQLETVKGFDQANGGVVSTLQKEKQQKCKFAQLQVLKAIAELQQAYKEQDAGLASIMKLIEEEWSTVKEEMERNVEGELPPLKMSYRDSLNEWSYAVHMGEKSEDLKAMEE